MEWEFEETVLLIDLFNYTKNHEKKEIEEAIELLSDFLVKRARSLEWKIENEFRNHTEISMKLQNINYIDSNGEIGLSSYTFMDEKTYLFSIDKPIEFNQLVAEIKNKYARTELNIDEKTDDIAVNKEIKTDTLKQREQHAKNSSKKDNECTYAERFRLNPDFYDDIKISVGVQGFSIRTCNRFIEANINTVGDLLRKKESTLENIKGFGKKCLDEVIIYLRELQKKTINPNLFTENNKPLIVTKQLKTYRNEIFDGNFSFEDTLVLTPEERKTLDAYKEGHSLLEPDLIEICRDNPEKLNSIYPLLQEIAVGWGKSIQNRKIMKSILKEIPVARMNNKVDGYINAYSEDNNIKSTLWKIYGSEDAKLQDIKNYDCRDKKEYGLVIQFLQWCNFNIEDEINLLFEKLYSKENQRVVLQGRSHNQTLEQVGSVLGITRERVRQIEAKVRKMFSEWYLSSNILAKISAVRNGDNILTYTELQEYFGEYFFEMYYLLKISEGLSYLYDKQLDVFIVQDADLSERVQEYIETLPDMFHKNKLKQFYANAEEIGLPTEMVELAIDDKYKITGDTYHRSRLSLQSIYNDVLKTYYKDGFNIYDEIELEHFRKIIFEKFGEVDLPKRNRALSAGITKIGILCGKGRYKSKEGVTIPEKLIEKICQYIDESENVIFLTNTLYSIFEDELLENGIDNKYYLQGILHEKVGNKYIFRRDYVSKDDSVTSIYMEVVNHIKQYDYPISKKQIIDEFPGLTDIVFSLSVGDSDIINMFGKYIHADQLKFLDSDQEYFLSVLEKLLEETGYVNAHDVFDYINNDDPIRLSRLFILQQFSLFSVLEYLFAGSYQFLRPYIAKLGMKLEHRTERLNEFIRNSDTISLSEINEFAREMHFQISNTLDFVNMHNDTHLLINDSEIMAIDLLEIDKSIIEYIETEIVSELKNTVFISELKCIYRFPKINVPWTDWLIYSIIKKWSDKLDVDIVSSISIRQLRNSAPVVALKGELDIGELNMNNISDEIYEIDDLDNIDDLISDIIAEEIEDK